MAAVGTGRHLVDVERLLQAHALQELQLGALDETIRRLVRQGAGADGAAQPKQQLTQQLTQLSQDYDRLGDGETAHMSRRGRGQGASRSTCVETETYRPTPRVTRKRSRLSTTQSQGTEVDNFVTIVRVFRSLIDAKHPKSAEIERRLTSLNKQWQILRELAAAREKQLADAAEAHQFYGDANEAESWMKEKRPLVATEDCGSDAPSAGALLARHRATHDELRAHAAELAALRAHAARLRAAGITELQVKALYAFTGQGISMQKSEIMFLINKTNPDWWSVRKADRTDGFVPANYVREIEPRVVPSGQSKELRRQFWLSKWCQSNATSPQLGEPAGLLSRNPEPLASRPGWKKSKRIMLEDAIKLYSFFAECDDFDKWIKDKEKMLRADDADDSVDTAKRNGIEAPGTHRQRGQRAGCGPARSGRARHRPRRPAAPALGPTAAT
ncbi:hypothetical protein HF086_007775 [Spodoptera exigua]|uniref:SH3 domain-containing protein n=1 Tax=Spodoptera exigua TaxID=7107 RepID=A0A922SI67_SPOEX|nr:hypothetical protein HF086_007775 [Spodoptera exigua]